MTYQQVSIVLIQSRIALIIIKPDQYFVLFCDSRIEVVRKKEKISIKRK